MTFYHADPTASSSNEYYTFQQDDPDSVAFPGYTSQTILLATQLDLREAIALCCSVLRNGGDWAKTAVQMADFGQLSDADIRFSPEYCESQFIHMCSSVQWSENPDTGEAADKLLSLLVPEYTQALKDDIAKASGIYTDLINSADSVEKDLLTDEELEDFYTGFMKSAPEELSDSDEYSDPEDVGATRKDDEELSEDLMNAYYAENNTGGEEYGVGLRSQPPQQDLKVIESYCGPSKTANRTLQESTITLASLLKTKPLGNLVSIPQSMPEPDNHQTQPPVVSGAERTVQEAATTRIAVPVPVVGAFSSSAIKVEVLSNSDTDDMANLSEEEEIELIDLTESPTKADASSSKAVGHIEKTNAGGVECKTGISSNTILESHQEEESMDTAGSSEIECVDLLTSSDAETNKELPSAPNSKNNSFESPVVNKTPPPRRMTPIPVAKVLQEEIHGADAEIHATSEPEEMEVATSGTESDNQLPALNIKHVTALMDPDSNSARTTSDNTDDESGTGAPQVQETEEDQQLPDHGLVSPPMTKNVSVERDTSDDDIDNTEEPPPPNPEFAKDTAEELEVDEDVVDNEDAECLDTGAVVAEQAVVVSEFAVIKVNNASSSVQSKHSALEEQKSTISGDKEGEEIVNQDTEGTLLLNVADAETPSVTTQNENDVQTTSVRERPATNESTTEAAMDVECPVETPNEQMTDAKARNSERKRRTRNSRLEMLYKEATTFFPHSEPNMASPSPVEDTTPKVEPSRLTRARRSTAAHGGNTAAQSGNTAKDNHDTNVVEDPDQLFKFGIDLALLKERLAKFKEAKSSQARIKVPMSLPVQSQRISQEEKRHLLSKMERVMSLKESSILKRKAKDNSGKATMSKFFKADTTLPMVMNSIKDGTLVTESEVLSSLNLMLLNASILKKAGVKVLSQKIWEIMNEDEADLYPRESEGPVSRSRSRLSSTSSTSSKKISLPPTAPKTAPKRAGRSLTKTSVDNKRARTSMTTKEEKTADVLNIATAAGPSTAFSPKPTAGVSPSTSRLRGPPQTTLTKDGAPFLRSQRSLSNKT